MQFGSAKGLRNFILITLGTGVGSGFVSNGELIYGHDGFAGELGHVIVRENGRVCGCGRLGCLETYCSATGVVLTAKEKLSQSLKSELHQIPIHELNSAHISKAAGNGDVLALEVIDETARILAIALANAVAITSPDHIFIYGGLSHAGEILLQPLRKYFDSFLLKNYRNKVKILPSGLPDEAAICGAAALAWNKL
jgi:glucokinase